MESKSIKIILVFVFFMIVFFCYKMNIFGRLYNDTKEPYYKNLVDKKFILIKNIYIAKQKHNLLPKEPKIFILTPKIVISKSNYEIVGKLTKGTNLKFKNVYTYIANIDANGQTFYTAEVVDKKNKVLIVETSGILENIWIDRANLKSQKRFDPAYAVEATPENIAKIEKEIEEEKQRK
jgi:hypothetical protein